MTTMSRRVYLAAPFADLEKMPDLAAKFDSSGIPITHRWWIQEQGQSYDSPPKDIARWALADYFGVVNADIVVLFSTGFSEGKAVEQGVAIALEKPIVAVGRRGEFKNVFHFLSNYSWVDTVEEAVAMVTTGKGLWSPQ